MYRFLTLVVLSAFLIWGYMPALGEDKGPTASFEDFQEWGKRLEGRWVVKVTFIADWPGQEKKQGEEITSHAIYRWVADRRGLEEVSIAGNSEARRLHYWDAGSRQIKILSVDSGGTTFVVSFGRKGDRWPWTAIGHLPDGTKMEGKGENTLTADGNSIVAGTVILGGKKLPTLHDVGKKVSK